jgi:type II secretory pathway component PulL
MRRWRVVLAGAALAASTLVTAGPAQAANDNSQCRVASNQARAALRQLIPKELWGEFNKQFTKVRNDVCGSLDD